jgi:hypothetical protein
MASPSVYHSDISMGMSRGNNVGEYHFDRNMTRDPENVVTIFTVNTREQYSASAGAKFAGRAADERYRKVGTISDPKYTVDNLSIEGNKDQRKVTADDGKWVAMDWLNPDNVFSLDQDFVVQNRVDDSTDLLARGLFFIVRPFDPINGNADDKPTEAEITPAEKRLRARYTAKVRLYETTKASNPGKLPNILNEEMIDALNYARLKTPYNTALSEMKECETCGDSIPAGAKFHRSESLGVICIHPSQEGWKAAVNAGIKTRDEVPDGFRWAGRSPNPA